MVIYGDVGLELLKREKRVAVALWLALGPVRRAFRVTIDNIVTSFRYYRIV
jgi:hypothetical protein